MSKLMSAARPSCERWGAWMFVTEARAPTFAANVRGHRVQVGSGQPAAARLHEDHLAGGGLARREGLVDDLCRAAGLADALLGFLERLLGDN